MKRIILLFAAVIVMTGVQAQAIKRVEIEAKVRSDDYNIAPVGSEGIIVFSETKEKVKGKGPKKKIWSFSKYDTDFKEVWQKDFPIGKKVHFETFEIEGDELFLYFSEMMSGTSVNLINKNSVMQVVKLNFKTGDFKEVTYKSPVTFKTTAYSVAENSMAYQSGFTFPSKGQIMGKMCLTYAGCCIPIFFGSLDYNYHPVLFANDMKKGTKTVIPIVHGKGKVKVLGVSGSEGKRYAVVSTEDHDHKMQLHLREIKGTKLGKDVIVKQQAGKVLLNATVADLGKDKVVVGTYASAPAKKSFMQKLIKRGQSDADKYAEGMYFTKFTKNKQSFIKYYDFMKFSNFNTRGEQKYANSKKKAEKAKKKKAKGKAAGLRYRLLMHDMMEIDGEYVMLAEAYYAQYHTEYYTDANGNRTSRRVFDGWKHTHAILAAFDNKGNKLYDHVFDISSGLAWKLKKRVKLLRQGSELVLAYSYGGAIHSKVVKGSTVLKEERSADIDTGSDKDDVKKNYSSDVDYWYDNYFISYGYQKIKVKKEKGKKRKKGEKRKRQVFYFNKIAYK